MNVIILTGQTATGKTDLAIELAKQHNGELINCDSRQIYKHLDIISGKDLTNKDYTEVEIVDEFSLGYYRIHASKDPQYHTKVWLYDITSPKVSFSSYNFEQCALHILEKLIHEGKTIILVGGTYFYLFHLLYNAVKSKAPPDDILRKKYDTYSVEKLQIELQSINPQLFKSLNESDRFNPHRLIRKIEISRHQEDFHHEKQDYTITLGKKLGIPDLEIEYRGLKYKDRAAERKSIESRVEKRFKEGALDEIRKLLDTGFNPDDPGMKTIGYQQLIPVIKGQTSLEKATEEWITKEMQYAKRQFTFMKKDPNIIWEEV